MEFILALPAQKEGSVTDVKKPKTMNEATDKNRKSLMEHHFQRRDNEIRKTNINNEKQMSKKHENVPYVSPYIQHDYGKKGDKEEGNRDEIASKKIILALPAPKDESVIDVNKLKRKNEATDNHRKSLIEDDLQRSGNEIGIRNSSTNNEKQTSKMHEIVPYVSSYFQNDNRNKGDNGERNTDENANKKIILALPAPEDESVIDLYKLKRKNEETDNHRKSLIEDDLLWSGNEIGIGNYKTNNEKQTSKEHEIVPYVSSYFQNDYWKKRDYGERNTDENANKKIILALPAPEDESVIDVYKLKRKNEETDNYRKSLIEDDLQRSGNEIGIRNSCTNNEKQTSEMHEIVPYVSSYFQNDNRNKGDNGERNTDEISKKKIILALPAQKEGSVINVKKLKRKNEETDNTKKSLIEDDLQWSGNEIGNGNSKTNNEKQTSKEHEKVPYFSSYFKNDYRKKGDYRDRNTDENAKKMIILALPAQKEGRVINPKKLKRKNEETAIHSKSVIEDDLQRSRNEIGIGNSKTNNERQTSKKHEKIPYVCLNFQNGYRKKGDNKERNTDEISKKKIILALPAQKEGRVINPKKLKRKNEETANHRKSVIEDDLQRSCNEIGIGNSKTNNVKQTSKDHEKVPYVSSYFQNEYRKKGDNREGTRDEIANKKFILALPAQKEGSVIDVKKLKRKNEETNNTRKSLIEDDLQRSGNEIGIRNNNTNNEKQTSKKYEKVPKVSPCVRNFNRKKGDDGEENGNDIAIEKIISKGKRRLMRHEPHCYEKKVDSESCCYGSDENGHETAIGKIKSKQKIRSKKHEPQGYNEKVDAKLCCYGIEEDRNGNAIEKIKSKRKRRLKKHEPQDDNEKKVDTESCYGREGKGDETAIGKITSKQERRSKHEPQGDKKKVDTELCCYGTEENGDEIATKKMKSKRKIRSKKREPQGDNKEKIDPESCCYDCDIGFVEDKLLKDGRIKSKEKKKKKAVEDKLWENDDDAETSKFIFKKREPQGDNGEKINPESCCYGCDIGFIEDKLLADGKIKSMENKKKTVEDERQENGKIRYNKKVDAEFCSGSEGNGDETAIGKIKSKQKKRLKKHEPLDDNKKVDTELCCYGNEENGHKIAIEKINSKRKKMSKKCEPQGENKKNIDPQSCCYGCDIGFVEDKLLADGKIKSKKKKKKPVENELLENGDDAETSEFKLKKTGPEVHKNIVHNGTTKKTNVKPLDKESKSEAIALPTIGDVTRDKLEEDVSRVQINRLGCEGYVVSVVLTSASGYFFEDKLKENGNGFECISIKFKKRKFNSQKTVEESAKVRKVSPYFQIDNVKNKGFQNKLQDNKNDAETSNVKPIKMESMVQIKLEGNNNGEKIKQGEDSHSDSVVVTVSSRDFGEVQRNGNDIKVKFMKKRK